MVTRMHREKRRAGEETASNYIRAASEGRVPDTTLLFNIWVLTFY